MSRMDARGIRAEPGSQHPYDDIGTLVELSSRTGRTALYERNELVGKHAPRAGRRSNQLHPRLRCVRHSIERCLQEPQTSMPPHSNVANFRPGAVATG
jgi:hypothetical protein